MRNTELLPGTGNVEADATEWINASTDDTTIFNQSFSYISPSQDDGYAEVLTQTPEVPGITYISGIGVL